MSRNKRFKLKIKLSLLSEEEKRKLLFECFDILFSFNKKKHGNNLSYPKIDSLEKFDKIRADLDFVELLKRI